MKAIYPGFASSMLLGTCLFAGCDITKSISVPANAHWANGESTVNGDITIGADAVVDGDLLTVNGDVTAKKPEFDSSDTGRPPVMVVGPHASVTGSITFERPGKLYVSDSAVIHGVQGVMPEKFPGAAPAGVRLPACPSN
ncbi:MAG: hypothetical protein KGJ56_05910 [Gammaproteobacteria bacterium]|nr:hypothetical protein [Gammaproteobacteria bacterium]